MTNRFVVCWEGVLIGGDADTALAGLCKVMDEMHDCEGLLDPMVERDAPAGTVRIQAAVDAEDMLDAMQLATYLMRTCLHSVGVGTPSWPALDDVERSNLSVRFQRDPSIEELADV